MKHIFKIFLLGMVLFVQQTKAQQIKGQLTINNKETTRLELSSASAVHLFKNFKEGKYKIGFNFKADELQKNSEGEFIVFFDFKTVIKKDGKVLRRIKRHMPVPFFPGEMFLPAEAFDFISVLSVTSWDDMVKKTFVSQEKSGIMKSGNYEIELSVVPKDVEAEVTPVTFGFSVR